MTAFFASLTEAARLRVATRQSFRNGALVNESARISFKAKPQLTFNLVLRERGLRLHGVFGLGIVVKMLQRIALHESRLTATPKVVLHETLAVAQREHTAYIYQLVVRSALKLSVTSGLGIGAVLRETLSITSKLDRLYAAIAQVTDQISVTSRLGLQLRIVVIAREGASISERDVERMIFAGRLSDALAFTMGFYDPASDTTTWAVNARTGAVTEYTDYGFNSFAPYDVGYVAASKRGLYELAGDTDAGQPIIADMISGLMEMTGSNLGSIRAAYIAIRGQGEMFLKITANEGRSTTYRVLARSLHTARVNMGKGWRARYFSYQLVTTGQDFDLNSVEFLPVVAVRRI